MKIAVLVKEVPDTYGARKLDLETGIADRAASEAVLDEISERALEVALTHADGHAGTEVVVVGMAPASAAATLRKGLSMGADSVLHIVDDALSGADIGLTAEVLAAAVRRLGADLVIAGDMSTDGAGGVIPSMIAEHLGMPQLTSLSSVHIEEGSVSGTRASDLGVMAVSASLPAVISITESLPDARFPNFKGIMAAKKKPFEVLSAGDLSIDAVDASGSRSIMIAVEARPPRTAGVTVVDDGNGGSKIAEFLIQSRLV